MNIIVTLLILLAVGNSPSKDGQQNEMYYVAFNYLLAQNKEAFAGSTYVSIDEPPTLRSPDSHLLTRLRAGQASLQDVGSCRLNSRFQVLSKTQSLGRIMYVRIIDISKTRVIAVVGFYSSPKGAKQWILVLGGSGKSWRAESACLVYVS